MSRLKIFLLILIIAALSIVFIQNREPTTLKFLCGYGSSYCLFRSTELPLALWIGLFTLNGIAINLLGQVLNRYSYSGSKRQKYVPDDELYPNETKWREDSTANNYSNLQDTIKDKFRDATSYEARQEPQNVERSGSTYSYKYKEADRTKSDRDKLRKTPVEPDVNSTTSTTSTEDDEDWI